MKIQYIGLDSNRLTDEDRERIRARTCNHQTGYGLPGTTYCGRPLSAGEIDAGQIECTEHEQDIADNYPTHAVIRLRQESRQRQTDKIIDTEYTVPSSDARRAVMLYTRAKREGWEVDLVGTYSTTKVTVKAPAEVADRLWNEVGKLIEKFRR